MDYPRAPVFSMSGFQLGFGLAKLTQMLVETSRKFVSISPDTVVMRQNEEEFYTAGTAGEVSLPKIRALIIRYVTLIIAKECPDLEWREDMEYGDDFNTATNVDAVKLAEQIQEFCSRLLEFNCNKVGKTLAKLDELLAQHAHICSQLWPKLYARARECSEFS